MDRGEDLVRIVTALAEARKVLRDFVPGKVEARQKDRGRGPLTEADEAVNRTLERILPRAGEGWLSEETADDRSRLDHERVWVVDPLDGTKEFVEGVPEWCVSIALVEEGAAVAGGVCNPQTGQTILGAEGKGVLYNDKPAGVTRADRVEGATVLASRSEVARGEWKRFEDAPFEVQPTGSVAYKLALVAAGKADATWTLVPKHEWDVAAGVALVLAGGGRVVTRRGEEPRFNRSKPRLSGLLAANPYLAQEFLPWLGWRLPARS